MQTNLDVYEIGERFDFPCGCSGYYESMEHTRRDMRKRLVVVVAPECRLDNMKVGKTSDFLRYEGKA